MLYFTGEALLNAYALTLRTKIVGVRFPGINYPTLENQNPTVFGTMWSKPVISNHETDVFDYYV
jgi:hypothetical protein